MHYTLKEPKSKNKTLIFLRFYVVKEKKYFKISTNIKINPDKWDKKNRLPIRKRGVDGFESQQITSRLLEMNNVLKDLRLKHGQELTIGDLKLAFNKKVEILYAFDYFESFIDERIKVGEVSDRSVIKYKTVLKKLVLFQIHKKTKYKLSDLKEDFFTSLIIYFRNNHNLYDNTVARYISVIKTFLRWCLKKGYSPPIYFQDVKVKKHETDDIALTMAEVELFTKADLTPAQDRCRDLFLIGVYSGQRWSDYSVFDKTDVRDNVIVKRAKKTSTNSYIPLHKELKVILDKYDWELPQISQQKFNIHLKAIGKKLKINDKIKFTHSKGNLKEEEIKEKWELITSHTARRTYITLAAENNIPDHTIMDITGIRDSGTLKKYKKSNKESNVELTKKLFNF